MAKPDETAERKPEETWGTWEELLLGCAVNRYGTKSWESVAIEVQKRSSASALHLLTPHNCKQKYHDLKRRYTPHQNHDVSERDGVEDDDDSEKAKTGTIPWLDELRKLRVAELKRELERYDLSIVSLQLKVKKLKEEREESLRVSENGEESDVGKSEEREREEEDTRGEGEPEKSSPELLTGKPVSGEESDRDNQSVNESNSTDPKCENLETFPEEVPEKEPEPVRNGGQIPGPAGDSGKPVREDSCNGSSDSIAKEPVRESVKVEPEGEMNDSPELWESVAESKGGDGTGGRGRGREEGTKESSDVQSSASKSRKEENDKVPCGSSNADERENEDQSPAIKGVSIKSHPLVDFLEIVRSHKLGSVFERRLESQETSKYSNLIRQHMDLETVRLRLEEGWYSGCNEKFFRDLLLLANNAIVFFGKKSSESVAAIELRQLISKEMAEMAQRNSKSDLSAEKQISLPLVSLPLKQDPDPSDSLLLKPKISGPLIVCRKRSSIAAKASASSSGVDRKREQTAVLAEEKPVLDWQQPNKTSVNADEHRITKKRTGDRFASGSRSSKRNGKNTNSDKNSVSISNQNQGKGVSHSEHSEPRSEKKNNSTVADVKKRSATSFLNRMKVSSSSNNGSLLESLKKSVPSADNNSKGGAEQKRNGNRKGDSRKDQVYKRSSGGRQAKEQGSPAKRSVGRPPKRAATSPPLLAVSSKRSREAGETEAVASRQLKKKSRK